MQEMQVLSLGWEDSPGEGYGTHVSILAWEIPRTEESGWLQSKGLQKSWTQLTNKTHTYTHTHTHTEAYQLFLCHKQKARMIFFTCIVYLER